MGQIVLRIDADEANAVTAFRKLTAAQQQSELAALKAGAAGDKAGKQAGQGADFASGMFQKAGRDLLAWAAGFGTLSAAVGLAKKAIAQLNAERERGATAGKEAEPGFSKLAQLAGGDQQRLAAMIASTKQTMAETGMPAEKAAQLQYALESEGMQGGRKMFAETTKIGVDPTQMVEAVDQMATIFGDQAGSQRQILNQLVATGKTSGTGVSELAPYAVSAAQASKELGGTMDELLATLGVMSHVSRSTKLAASDIESLSKALIAAQPKLPGAGQGAMFGMPGAEAKPSGMISTIQAIQKMGLSPAELEKLLGGQGAAMAFRAVSEQLPTIQAARGGLAAAKAGTGGAEDLLTGMVKTVEGTPLLAGVQRARQAKAAADIAEMEKFGAAGLETQTAAERFREEVSGLPVRQRLSMRAARGILSPTAVLSGATGEDVSSAVRMGFQPSREELSLRRQVNELFEKPSAGAAEAAPLADAAVKQESAADQLVAAAREQAAAAKAMADAFASLDRPAGSAAGGGGGARGGFGSLADLRLPPQDME